MEKEVYPPREDSLFLKEYVKKFSRGNILDMGCGSGIQSKTALENNEVNKVISIDLNENALKKTSEIKDERLKVIKSDLFSSLNNKYYDFFNLIIFNPPYLPSSFNDKYLDKGTKLATVGGKKGNETIIRFIKKLNYFLKNKGTCLLLYSSKSRPKEIFNELRYNLLNYELLDKREMQDSEKLFIIKIEKKNVLKRINKKYKVDYLTKGSHSYVFLNQDNQLIKVTNNVSLGSIKKEYDICKYIENSSYNDKINIPKHYSIDSKNEFLVREYIKGEEFDKLIPNLDKSELKKILKNIIYQAYFLDKIKVNKEEMHRVTKNLIINSDEENKPYFIDFERASKTENPKNLTQMISFLYRFKRENIIKLSKEELIRYAKKYSKIREKSVVDELIDKLF